MRGLLRVLPLPILLFTWAAPTHALQVSCELEPREITVGDHIEMMVRVEAPRDAEVVWPLPEQFAPAEVLDQDTLESEGDYRLMRYLLSLFEPGKAELPELSVIVRQGSQIDTLRFDPGVIQVISVIDPADSLADIQDVHPPVALSWRFEDLLPYIAAGTGVIALLVILLLVRRWIRRRRGEIPAYVPPPIPPHVIAQRRLEDLRLKKLWQNGYLKEFHSELTEIVKEYIGNRFNFNAPEMTSEELLALSSHWSSDKDTNLLIRKVLVCADLVKFARFRPEPSENDRCLDAGFEYVKLTCPVENLNARNGKTDAAVSSGGGS